jgi:hypothetical protein
MNVARGGRSRTASLASLNVERIQHDNGDDSFWHHVTVISFIVCSSSWPKAGGNALCVDLAFVLAFVLR